MKRALIALILTLGVGLLIVAAAPIPASAVDANWPQWRGPESSGISLEKNLPTEWNSTKNIKWKTPLPGRGHTKL